MGQYDPPLFYDDMLDVFKESLTYALSGRLLPHTSANFSVTVMLALLDVANAARQNRPTEGVAGYAAEAFARYAADFAVDVQTSRPPNIVAMPEQSSAVVPLKAAN